MINPKLILPVAVIGDVLALGLALVLSLAVRAQALPQATFLATHAEPLFLVLVSSLVVYYINSLYDIHTINQKRKLLGLILYAQAANAILAIVFFYFISIWGITPKTILVLYIIISSSLLTLWRVVLLPALCKNLRKEKSALIARQGVEAEDLQSTLSGPSPYPLCIEQSFFISEQTKKAELLDFLRKTYEQKNIKTVILDTRDSWVGTITTELYAISALGVRVLPFTDVYEDVFLKIPESSLQAGSVLSYIYGRLRGYALMKRCMDLTIAAPVFLVSLLVYPFVYIGLKIQDGGPVFFVHDRMGRDGRRIKLYKFRSMTFGDTSAVWVKTANNKNSVTKFGYFLRKTRIDELPQLWNVLRGDMSLIGPRPDIWSLGVKSAEEIDFYKIRLLVPPGLSGWAQTHMSKPPQDMAETRVRLLYDLYYVKNASLVLDLSIALKTIRTLLSREGM